MAPQTLRLDATQSGEVTVHIAIGYGLVDKDSLTLSGVPAQSTFADNRGELVAKFDEWAVKDLVDIPSATLVLSGQTVDGEAFAGSDTVKVVDCQCPP